MGEGASETVKNGMVVRLILIFLLLVLFLLSLGMGRYDIPLSAVAGMVKRMVSQSLLFLGSGVNGASDSVEVSTLLSQEMVFFWIRLPRCLMAVLVGMGLSLSGAVYQAIFRNPLVSPDILGVAAGCTFGAALGFVFPENSMGLVQVLSFTFGLFAVSLTLGIARLIAVRPIVVMILSGMVVMSFFNAMIMILKYFADPYDELPSIVFWTMGSFSRIGWQDIQLSGPVVLLGSAVFMLIRFRLNVLSMGDTRAGALGMNPALFRVILILISAVMVSVMVATCGQISWIALIVPHMARTLVGPKHEDMLPVTALLGALLMLAADGAARSLTTAELPVGIVTALTGAPFFGYLLYKNRGSGWL